MKLKNHADLLKNFPNFESFYKKKIEIMMLVEKLNVALQTKGCKPIVPTKIKMLKKKMLNRTYLAAAMECTHTMVCHCVGYHYDVFDRSSSGIENKVLLIAEGKGGKKGMDMCTYI